MVFVVVLTSLIQVRALGPVGACWMTDCTSSGVTQYSHIIVRSRSLEYVVCYVVMSDLANHFNKITKKVGKPLSS